MISATSRKNESDRKPATEPELPVSRSAWLTTVIRERIITGVYAPGEPIREGALQKEFGVSNGPVREALQIIVGAGFAERSPWHGVRVINLDKREILELFQLRTAIIQYVVELAARHGKEEIFAQGIALKETLRSVHQPISEKGEPLVFRGRLAAWLLAAAENNTISRLWDDTLARAQIYVNSSVRVSSGPLITEIVCELIDAVIDRDVPAAHEAVKRLARRTLANLGIEGPI